MKYYLAILALAATLPFASSANAALVFVGYWDVADLAAPLWDEDSPHGPLAYTGQEAAAYVFGGVASEYMISTVDDSVGNIDNMAWYDVIGVGGFKFAEDYFSKYQGLYYGPTDSFDRSLTGSASAFVRDSLTQGVERNYAFKDNGVIDPRDIPEPSIVSLFFVGLMVMGFVATTRRTKAVA